MEATTTPPTTTPAAGNWYDRLPPTVRAVIVAAATLLLNAALAWLYTHLTPGTPAPQLPVPQVQSTPAVLVLNVGPTPAAPVAPVSVAGK